MSIEGWTLAIAVVSAIVCALCGGLLLVNRQAMVSEGLSHAVLPGIVIAFILLRDINSPWLIPCAALSGLVMVWLTHMLQRTRLVDDDAGLGIVFSAMFSVGILLVSQKLRNTHFHADCVIDGNLALAPLDRFVWQGIDWGPRSFLIMSVMLLIVSLFLIVCYKELKVMLFDPMLASRFGLRPTMLQYICLTIVSLTAVAAFDVAGSVLIVALMIAPPAAAYLLVDRLGPLLLCSALIAVISAVVGFYLAMAIDVSPTGPIASTAGFVFLSVFALAPRRGIIAVILRRRRQRVHTIQHLLLDLIATRDRDQLSWNETLQNVHCDPGLLRRALEDMRQGDYITPQREGFKVTDKGRALLSTGPAST